MKRLIKILLFAILNFCLINISQAQQWDTLGTGLAGTNSYSIYTLYADSITNKLYVGGSFNYAGNMPVSGIAAWDGSKWDTLGGGAEFGNTKVPRGTNGVSAIIRYKNYLYVGGGFTWFGNGYNTQTRAIARWDGSTWGYAGDAKITTNDTVYNPLNNSSYVGKFDIYNDTLYACGDFTRIGGTTLKRPGIAKTGDGINWMPVGPLPLYTGPDTIPQGTAGVDDFIFYNNELYIADTYACDYRQLIAKWDGTKLSQLGSGFSNSSGFIDALCVYKNELYVGGYFMKQWGAPGNFIARWDGNQWKDVGNGLTSQVASLFVFNNELYVGGNFNSTTDGLPNTAYIAKWDGTQWYSLGAKKQITNGYLCAMENFKGYLYAGQIGQIDSMICGHIINFPASQCDDVMRFDPNTTGIASIQSNKEKNILYPNPVTETATFSYTLPIGNKNAFLRVYDINGRMVASYVLSSPDGSLNVSVNDFENGVYLYGIEADNYASAKNKMVVVK